MQYLEFKIDRPLSYDMAGKFEAPSPNWMHSDEYPLKNYELIIPTKDTLYLNFAKKNHTIPVGSYIILPPWPAPMNRRIGFRPSPCSFYWLHFEVNHEIIQKNVPESELDAYKTHLPKNTLSIPYEGQLANIDKIVILMKQLQDAVKEKYPPSLLDYFTTSILCELHFQMSPTPENSISQKKSKQQIYYDIIDFVKQNISKPLKVSDIASHFSYNESYLSHFFTSIADISLKQLILNLKIDAANILLVDTNKTISEISAELAFSSAQHFVKVYKKKTGLTPTAYRNAFSQRLLYHK
ncbi:MAG: AraC family transcriptional regulator [Eubacteriales bacterium]|nr:AraC family transcriptional regulator [Eubacteriales bacterium]